MSDGIRSPLMLRDARGTPLAIAIDPTRDASGAPLVSVTVDLGGQALGFTIPALGDMGAYRLSYDLQSLLVSAADRVTGLGPKARGRK